MYKISMDEQIRKKFDENKYILILTEDKELLKIYCKIWNKFSSIINKTLDKNLVYKKKYLNTKIKHCNGKCVTNLHYTRLLI